MLNLNALVRKSDTYARGQLKAWHIEETSPIRDEAYWAVFTSQLAYLLDHPDDEEMIGHLVLLPEVKVGGTFYCSAGAPGCGHTVYQITRIEDGVVYGKIVEDTMREMRPEECI